MAKGKETPTGEKEQQGRGGGDRGSTAARPTLTRDWGGPQVRDPMPIISVNPRSQCVTRFYSKNTTPTGAAQMC